MRTLNSIRWRLPLTYAAIALLTAALLGILLLATLRDHYAQMETAFLQRNATIIGRITADLLDSGVPPEALQTQFQSFSFFSGARVRVLSPDYQQVLVDSGVLGPGRPMTVEWMPFNSVTVANPAAGTLVNADMVYFTVMNRFETAVATPTEAGHWVECLPLYNGADCSILNQDVMVVAGAAPAVPPPDKIAIVPTMYGFELSDDFRPLPAQRSRSVVEVPVYGTQANLLGYVELSEGPAYGTEIIDSVARGCVLASVLAVTLAALAGWIASRNLSVPLLALTNVTQRMAQGDLSARACIPRKDEIGTLAQTFNLMAGQVEETVSTLRRFMADAAHELNTPITALRTNLELAAAGERTTIALERAQAQVWRMETLTKALLQLARIESGSVQEKRTQIDVARFTQETTALYASQAEQAGVELRLDLPATEIKLRADEAQLRAALGNLLDNAIKFTPEGGVVSICAQKAASQIEIAVSDTGIGIAEEDMPYLFDRFYRGNNTAHYPGSGLGLAIVQAIVERSGGTVNVERLDVGTRFTMRLPSALGQ